MDDINVRDYGALGDGKDYTSSIKCRWKNIYSERYILNK